MSMQKNGLGHKDDRLDSSLLGTHALTSAGECKEHCNRHGCAICQPAVRTKSCASVSEFMGKHAQHLLWSLHGVA
jgi:hypothetical protein